MPDFDLLNPTSYTPPSTPSVLPNPGLQPVAPPSAPSFNPEKLGSGEADDVSNLLNYFAQPPKNAQDYTASTTNELHEQGKRFSDFDPNISNYEAYKAYGQSGWDRVANAGINLVTKVVAYLGQTVGFIGGAIPAAIGGTVNMLSPSGKTVEDGNAISLMTDNFLVRGSEALKNWIQDAAPIYKGYEYQNGNIWDKLGTTSWWLDDAIDRTALTLSMLVPGVAETKGLSLFGAAARGAEGVEATGVVSKILANSLKNPQVSNVLGKIFSKGLIKAGIESSGAAGEIAANTGAASLLKGMQYGEIMAWNIIGQNALNARESQVAIREKLEEQNQKGLANYTPEQIDALSAEGARKAFLYNLPLNLASSLFELPQVFPSLKGQSSILKGLEGSTTLGEFSEKLAQVSVKSKPSLLGITGKAILTAIEHGQVESAQVAIGRYIEDSIAGKIVDGKVEKNEDNPLIESIKEMINNFSDPNGQNNIALGTIQGLLTTIFGHAYKSYTGEYKKEQTFKNQYLYNLKQAIVERRMINGDMDLVMKDENGKAKVDENGNFLYNQAKIAQLGASYIDALNKAKLYKEALDNNDIATIERMNHNTLANLAKEFFKDKNGLELFKDMLKLTSLEEEKNINRKNIIINNIEQAPEVQLQKAYDKVDKLYEIHKTIRNSNPSTILLDYNRNDDGEVAFLNQYLEAQKDSAYKEASKQLFYSEKLTNNNIELANHESQLGVVLPNERDKNGYFINPSSPAQVRINEILKENEQLTSDLDKAKKNYRIQLDPNEIQKGWEEIRNEYRAISEKIKNIKKEKANSNPDNKSNNNNNNNNNNKQAPKYEVGKNYLVGKRITLGGKENKEVVVRPSSITINEIDKDGNIKGTDNNGNEIKLSKEQADSYLLFEKDENNDSHAFYEAHDKDVFSYTFGEGKDKTEKQGVLQYNPDSDELFFTFQNNSGKLSHIPVTPDMMLNGRLKISEKLNKETEEQKKADERYTSQKNLEKSKKVTESKLNERKKLILQRIKELQEQNVKSNEQITKKENELNKINHEFAKIVKEIKQFGSINAKDVIESLSKQLQHLGNMKKSLLKEIDTLKKQIDDNEYIINYLTEYSKNIDTIPANLTEAMYELHTDLQNLKKLGKQTKEEYDKSKSLLEKIEDLVKSLSNTVARLVKSFNNKYNEDVINKYNETLLNDLTEPSDDLLRYVNDALELERKQERLSLNVNQLNSLKEKIEQLDKALKEYRQAYKAKTELLKLLSQTLSKFNGNETFKQKAKDKLIESFKKNVNNLDSGNPDDGGSPLDYVEDIMKNGNKKTVEKIASTSDPSGENGYNQRLEFQERHQRFLNRYNFLPNKKKLRIVIITQKNAEALGLKGIIDKALEGIPEEKKQREDTAIALYIEREGNKNFVIDENGKRLGELGKQVDLDKAVYSLMSSLSLNDSKNSARYNEKDENKLNKFLNWYQQLRQKWFNASPDSLQIYNFNVSRGIPNVYKTSKKVPVTKNLVPRERLGIKGLIRVSTGQAISVGKTTLKLGAGKLLIVDEDNYYFLNNKNITSSQASNILEALKSIAISLEKGNEIDNNVIVYLKSLLNISLEPPKGEVNQKNLIWIDGTNLVINSLGTYIPLNSKYLEKNAESIKSDFQKLYHTVNKNILNQHGEYYELIKIDEKGKPVFRVWKTYQQYLLSDKYELSQISDFEKLNGKDRKEEDIPLFTNLYEFGENSYPFKQKYSFLSAEEPEVKSSNKNNNNNNNNNSNTNTNKQKAPSPAEKNNSNPPAKSNQNTPNSYEVVGDGKDINSTDNIFSFDEGFKSETGGSFGLFEALKTINKKIDEQVKKNGNVNLSELFDSKEQAFQYYDDVYLTSGEQHSYPESLYEQFQKTGEVAPYYAQYLKSVLDAKERPLTRAEIQFAKEIKEKKSNAEKANTKEEEKAVENAIEEQEQNNKEVESPNIESSPSPEETYDNLDIPPWAQDSDNVDDKIANKIITSMDVPRLTEAEISDFREWMSKNLPNVPIHIVDKVISVLNSNRKAWGKVSSKGIELFRMAKKGTQFHEAFEVVFNFYLTPKEQIKLYNEFKNRKGEFENDNGETVKYSESSFYDFKEKLADEFYEYLNSKKENKSLGQKIKKFFNDIYEFIKGLFNLSTTSKRNRLYEKIDKGAYSKYEFPGNSQVSSEFYSKIGNLSVLESKELIEDIIANIGFDIVGNHDSNAFFYDLFEKNRNFNASEIYANVRKTIISNLGTVLKSLKKNIDETQDEATKSELAAKFKDVLRIGNLINNDAFWKEAMESTNEAMRTILKIKVDNDNQISIDEQNNQSKNDYVKNDFFIDSKKNATSAIKILLSTLVKADSETRLSSNELIPDVERNSYGGFKLLDFSKSFIDVLKSLSNTNTLDEMMKKLYNLSLSNPDYVRLFKRLKGNLQAEDGSIDFSNLTFPDIRLLMDFHATFSKQAPAPYLLNFNEQGEVFMSSANFDSLTTSIVDGWVNNLRYLSKKGNEFIKKDTSEKLTKYSVKINKELNFKRGKNPKETLKNEVLPILEKVGVKINAKTLNNLNDYDASKLLSYSEKFLKYLEIKNVTTINKQSITSLGNLTKMAEIIALNTDVTDKYTYRNIEGKQQQLYINHNYFSAMINDFNNVKTLDELLEKYPMYHDVFSAESVYLKKGGIYFDESGNRTSEKIEISYLNGAKIQNENIAADKLNFAQRAIGTINMLINELKPFINAGDASTEWVVKMKNIINFKDTKSNVYEIKMKNILSGYLSDEVALIQDVKNRNFNYIRNKKENNLRFFDKILSDKIKEDIYSMIEKDASLSDINSYIENNIDKIYEDFDEYLKTENSILLDTLKDIGIITENENLYYLEKIDSAFLRENNLMKKMKLNESEEDTNISILDKEELNNFLNYLNANYFIHSVELHKMYIGDPNQFSKLSDEFKRLKSFQSPARRIESNEKINEVLKQEKNNVNGVEVPDDVYGYVDFSDTKRTFTLSDFNVLGRPALDGNELYENVDRADGQMWMLPSMYKEIMIKGGMWKDEFDDFYNYDSALFRQWYSTVNEEFTKRYSSELLELKREDEKLIEKGYNKDYVTHILKPIIRGQKTGVDYIDTILDKTSAFPLFFSFTKEGQHSRDIIVKMFESKNDYTIVLSGRKIGAQKLYDFYKPNGEINDEPITNEHSFEIPITNFSIQMDTSNSKSEDSKRGTQITKEVSLNIMDNGVPVDYLKDSNINLVTKLLKWKNLSEEEKRKQSPLYDSYKKNEDILNRMIEHGYNQLLERLGIKDNNGAYEIVNLNNLHETLYTEMLRYDINQNAIDSIKFDKETNKFNIDFEASANYQRIKNIILSIVDKSIVSQKINGGGKIQLSSVFFDTNKTLKPYVKQGDKWVEVKDYDNLSDEEKKSVTLFSDNLKFYTKKDDKVEPMEVYLPHWFGDKFRKLGKTDDEIIEMINSDKKSQSILEGIGFRIPTQELNSMEVFKVKGFLPREAGDTIVVPSEITKKAGSDFDVDKLYTYLKNVIITNDGNIIEIPYEKYLKGDDSELRKLSTLKILQESFKEDLEDITDEDFKEGKTEADKVYNLLVKKALENAYIDSLKEMLLHENNYDRLIKPNDNHILEELADEISKYIKTDIQSKIETLSLTKTIENRNLSIFGKSYVGVGALAQSNHSISQKQPIYIDISKVPFGSYAAKYLGDGKVYLPHNSINISGKIVPTISGIFDRNGYYISDKISAYINGFVDIAKNSFLYRLGVNLRNAGVFIMLERLGVPSDYVAYFMNQPIIREYLKELDKADIRGIFNTDVIENIMQKYLPNEIKEDDENSKKTVKRVKDFTKEELKKELEKYSKGQSLNNLLQIQVFNEFLKYAKMSQHLRALIQGSTWDTSNFVDFATVDFKNLQFINSDKNIFGNLENLIGNTYIGKIRTVLNKGVDSLSSIFKLREEKPLNIINSVLYNIINPLNNFLTEDEIITTGNKVVSSFLDYAISCFTEVIPNKNLNSYLGVLFLTDKENSIPNLIRNIKNNESHPLNSNYFIQNVEILDEINGTNISNLKYIGGNDVLSENRIIAALSEIKDTNPSLYKNLIYFSILQSGIYKSPLSYTQLIPLDDYAKISENVISKLQNIPELSKFAEENLFLRNFWKSYLTPKKDIAMSKNGNFYNPFLIRKGNYPLFYQNLEKLGIPEFVQNEKGTFRNYNLPILVPTFHADNDIILIKTNNNADFSEQEIKKFKDAREYNKYKVIVGYKMVKDSNGNPIQITENGQYTKFLYKPINLYGDGTGTFLNEYRIDGLPSSIQNGTMKVMEKPDEVFENAFKFYIEKDKKDKNYKVEDSNKC
jgi:hypothetical protein